MKYVCAQPANMFYTWQVELVIYNFTKWGVSPNDMHILLSTTNGEISNEWKTLVKGYPDINFFFYEDSREYKGYIPAIYFDLLSNHLKAHPELKDEELFLHDSDIIFTRKPEVNWYRRNNTWYMSDTNSYINYDYIQSKGNDIYEGMCNIVGINKIIPKLMNNHSGGAQYIVKGEDYNFWRKVEKDSGTLYKFFNQMEPKWVKKHEHHYPIQKWTAGMWSLLWNAWRAGHPTEVDERLGFGWSTNSISDVDKHWILHNSGVTSNDKGLFFKSAYHNKLPYYDELDVDKTKASSYYWNEIKELSKVSVLTYKSNLKC